MGKVNQGKIICTRCQTEIAKISDKCACQKQCIKHDKSLGNYDVKAQNISKRQQRTLSAISLAVTSSILITLSSYFWYSVILDIKMYSLNNNHPFVSFTFLFAAWSFFFGCYCLVITLPELLSYRNITLIKHKIFIKLMSKVSPK